MQIYKKILVTIDCSPADQAILDHISALAIQNKARVYLLHVIHAHTLDQSRELKSKAETSMDQIYKRLTARQIQTYKIIRNGEPEKEILDEIKAKDYDLVAMATHGHSFLADLLFGSVSNSLKHKIDVPLLLIKSPK